MLYTTWDTALNRVTAGNSRDTEKGDEALDRPSVVVALELRSYREAIARAIARERPQYRIVEVAPDQLVPETIRLNPAVVLSSETRPLELPGPAIWITLYPNGSRQVIIEVGGKITTQTDIELTELLAVIDRYMNQ